jgi:hypothetical protein
VRIGGGRAWGGGGAWGAAAHGGRVHRAGGGTGAGRGHLEERISEPIDLHVGPVLPRVVEGDEPIEAVLEHLPEVM